MQLKRLGIQLPKCWILVFKRLLNLSSIDEYILTTNSVWSCSGRQWRRRKQANCAALTRSADHFKDFILRLLPDDLLLILVCCYCARSSFRKKQGLLLFCLCAVSLVASLKFAKKWGDQLNLHQQVPCQYSREHMSQFACKNLWYWYFQIFELLENQGLEPELHTHHQLTCAVVEGDFLIGSLSTPTTTGWTTTGSYVKGSAQARPKNFVVHLSSTTSKGVVSRRRELTWTWRVITAWKERIYYRLS